MFPVLSTRLASRALYRAKPTPLQGSRCITAVTSRHADAPRLLSTASDAKQEQSSSWSKTPLLAVAGGLLGSAAFVSASADEEKHASLFTPDQVQVISVIGGPLCGKATHVQRIGKYFDALCIGPEDDIFSEVALGTAGGSTFRTCIQGWPRSAREAQWIEEELCPLTALVYIDVSPETAMKRTNERAASAVKSGHKLFHAISDELLDAYKQKGKLIVVDGNKSLEDTWKEIETKLSEVIKKGSH